MLEMLKSKLMSRGMAILQSPTVTRLLESEKVGQVVEKAMGVPVKVLGAVQGQKDRVVSVFELATREDVDDLRRALSRVESTLAELRKSSGSSNPG